MDEDRSRTLAAVTVIIGAILIVVLVVGIVLTRNTLVSPVPESNAIKIIFLTPTPSVIPAPPASPSAKAK
ncbi:hypothetical protein HY947_04670 [Candidatus Gottesmanbacteria bacterium]|nr:hypothetical protein [Candidatus Gottesmanbacteria bacterium]